MSLLKDKYIFTLQTMNGLLITPTIFILFHSCTFVLGTLPFLLLILSHALLDDLMTITPAMVGPRPTPSLQNCPWPAAGTLGSGQEWLRPAGVPRAVVVSWVVACCCRGRKRLGLRVTATLVFSCKSSGY